MLQSSEFGSIRQFTVSEYHRMADTGILGSDERVELVRGLVVEMSPRKRGHVLVVRRVFDLLVERLVGRASVYKEDPLELRHLNSEPEPDVWVGSNPDVEAYGTSATEPLLVVEVAEASRDRDLVDKVGLYAESGIPEYWVVDLVERVVVVFRKPRKHDYASREIKRPGDRLDLVSFADVEIDVEAFFRASSPT